MVDEEKPWNRRRPIEPKQTFRDYPKGQSKSANPGSEKDVPRPPFELKSRQTYFQPAKRSVWGKSTTRFLAVVTSLAVISVFAVLATNDSSKENSSESTSQITVGKTNPSATSVIENPGELSQWENLARSMVYIEATGTGCSWTGSGSIVLDGSYVLTNQHVSGDGECSLRVGLTDSTTSEPRTFISAEVIVADSTLDIAVLRLLNNDAQPYIDSSRQSLEIDYSTPKLGDKIFTLGYPGAGGATITLTSGDYSGMDQSDTDFYKTTANMSPGVSGGAAFNAKGKLIGIPTAGVIDPDTKERTGLNLIRPISFAKALLDQAQSTPIKKSSQSTSTGQVSNEESGDPLFGTCREAKSHGYGPYYVNVDSEYDNYFDRDQDGVVCE